MKEIVIVYRKYKHAVPKIIMIFNSAALYLTTQPTRTLILLWDMHEHILALALFPDPSAIHYILPNSYILTLLSSS